MDTRLLKFPSCESTGSVAQAAVCAKPPGQAFARNAGCVAWNDILRRRRPRYLLPLGIRFIISTLVYVRRLRVPEKFGPRDSPLLPRLTLQHGHRSVCTVTLDKHDDVYRHQCMKLVCSVYLSSGRAQSDHLLCHFSKNFIPIYCSDDRGRSAAKTHKRKHDHVRIKVPCFHLQLLLTLMY